MWDLDEIKMKTFYRRRDPEWTAKKVTSDSGIGAIIPGSSIDEHLFDPCGYSCNGLLDGTYFTIHVTPEPNCSFVSFETNISADQYNELIQKVVHIFQPRRWSVSLMTQGYQYFLDVRSLSDWHFQGFTNEGTTYHKFENQDNVIIARFKKEQDNKVKQKPYPKTYAQVIGRAFELESPSISTQFNFTQFIKQSLLRRYHISFQSQLNKSQLVVTVQFSQGCKNEDDPWDNFFSDLRQSFCAEPLQIQSNDFLISKPVSFKSANLNILQIVFVF